MKQRTFQLRGPDSVVARKLTVKRVTVLVTDGNYAVPERTVIALTVNRLLRTRLRIADPAVNNGGEPMRVDCTCLLSASPLDVGLGAFATSYTPMGADGLVFDLTDSESLLLHAIELQLWWPLWTMPDDHLAQCLVELEAE